MSALGSVVSRNVGRGRSIAVAATGPEADLHDTLYAVNWLDLRRPWLYKVYGLLTFPLARRAGARVLFKGDRIEVLSGNDPVGETLLMVSYPNAEGFLDLATRPSFAVLSLLRRAALSRFRFAFFARWDDGPEPPANPRRHRGSDAYLVQGFEEVPEEGTNGDAPASFFRGVQAAAIVAREGDGPWRPTKLAPPPPWKVLSLRAGPEEALRARHQKSPGHGGLGALYRRAL